MTEVFLTNFLRFFRKQSLAICKIFVCPNLKSNVCIKNLMTLFVQETGLALCLWILASITVAIALLLLSVFEGKRDELRENLIYPEGSFTAAITDCLIAPQERLKKLESRITTKCTKLEISQEKIEETKKTISELEVTSGEVQVKYQELLKQLKSELSRTEAECQNLHNQIEKITSKRDKLKQELDDVGSSLKSTKIESALAFEDELFISETTGKPYNFNTREGVKAKLYGTATVNK